MRVRKPKFVIGIPTVRRDTDYLLNTVDSLVGQIPADHRDQIELVVFNAELPPENHQQITRLTEKHHALIEAGFLTLIDNPEGHRQLPTDSSHGDPARYWTMKLVLDAVFLIKACRDRGDYYLHLEDDVIAATSFWPRFQGWFDEHFAERDDWFALALYSPYPMIDRQRYEEDITGFIALLFRCRDLHSLTTFLERHFERRPLDGLLNDYIRKTGSVVYAHIPSLFQHIGLVSSEQKKIQPLKSYTFQETPVQWLRRSLSESRVIIRLKWSAYHWQWIRINAYWILHFLKRVYTKFRAFITAIAVYPI